MACEGNYNKIPIDINKSNTKRFTEFILDSLPP